jgi:hypothetical protein
MTSKSASKAVQWVVLIVLMTLVIRSLVFLLSAIDTGTISTVALGAGFLFLQIAFLCAAVSWIRR